MTELVFRNNPYQLQTPARVDGLTEEGAIIVDASVFYPQGGGQPGDSGHLDWDGGRIDIANTINIAGELIALVPVPGAALPPVGAEIGQSLNWDRRYRHMKIHTALHLLSVVVPLPVTGGSITAVKGRLDFNMVDPLEDKVALADALNALTARDLGVHEEWITDEELAASRELVKTMSVRPPVGSGRVRLIRIGSGGDRIDLQPCGGTHVARTGEVGRLRIGKIEKKGKANRRIYLFLEDDQ